MFNHSIQDEPQLRGVCAVSLSLCSIYLIAGASRFVMLAQLADLTFMKTYHQEQMPVLIAVKILHTVIWVFFVACIAVIYVFAYERRIGMAAVFIGIVMIEVLVLAFNQMRCPLTGVASRYTNDCVDTFDIYLPLWLAKHNKLIFGTVYVAGIVYTLLRWLN